MITLAKVLIVGADHSTANQIEEYIKTAGYDIVSVASNGMAALQALNSVSFDLAIIDFDLPDSWSETVMHALNKKQMAAPVVVLCKSGTEKSGNQRLRNQQTYCLPRPFSKTELLEAAAKALSTTFTSSASH